MSSTSGGRAVGIVRLRTKGHGVCFLGGCETLPPLSGDESEFGLQQDDLFGVARGLGVGAGTGNCTVRPRSEGGGTGISHGRGAGVGI
jgi:hypothetical protein